MKPWDDPRVQRVRSNPEGGHRGGYGPGRRRVGSGPPLPGRSGYQAADLDHQGAPPESFDLEAYASRSFGVFQEEAEDIVLRFDPSAAPDARTYLFHPTHTMIDEADGSLTVRFRAAGLLQIAHHLMTWGPTVAILAPDRLKVLMWEEVEALHDHYRKMRRRPRAAKAAAE